MDFIWESITDWLKEILISGIVSNLSGMFDSTNEQVGNIVGQVGMTPQSWNSGIFTMIQNLSNTVILPIAGAILAIVMTLELIQLVTDRNNLNDVDTWMFFKWVFKSACAVVIVTHTWDIVMGIFEASQSVVSSAAGVIVGQTNIDISSVVGGLESRLNEMELGPLFGLWLLLRHALLLGCFVFLRFLSSTRYPLITFAWCRMRTLSAAAQRRTVLYSASVRNSRTR